MSYKLNPNLVPFLNKSNSGELFARLSFADKKNGVLVLQQGVQVTVPLKELDVTPGKSLGAVLEFDANGVLTKTTLDTPPQETKVTTSTRSGSATRRPIPQF